jgi:hypothetical protein
MGYTNYWRWKIPLGDANKFAEWSSDVQHLLDELSTTDRELPVYVYQGGYKPLVYRSLIRGPSGRGEPVITSKRVAFNGDASTGQDCEPFSIKLTDLEHSNPFASCKTEMHAYDLLVICALVRLAHYFPDIRISSDGEEKALQMGVQLCREVFGNNALVPLDNLEDEEEIFPE